jgi:hypothetical protein
MRAATVPANGGRRAGLRRFRQRRFWAQYGLPAAILVSCVLNEMHVDAFFPGPVRIVAYIFIAAVTVWHLRSVPRMIRAQRKSRPAVWYGPAPAGLPRPSASPPWPDLARPAGDQGGGTMPVTPRY